MPREDDIKMTKSEIGFVAKSDPNAFWNYLKSTRDKDENISKEIFRLNVEHDDNEDVFDIINLNIQMISWIKKSR